MRISFTGTQIGMSDYQKKQLVEFLSVLKDPTTSVGIHGDCIGADKEFHDIAKAIGAKVEIHPPDRDIKRAFCVGDVIKEPLPYLERNHNIVDSCDLLIAAPKNDSEELRSGTWATIRYARKKNKQVLMLKREKNGRSS